MLFSSLSPLTHLPPSLSFPQSPLTDSVTLQRDASPAPGRRASSVKTEGGGGGGKPREAKEKDKLERRLMEVHTVHMYHITSERTTCTCTLEI